MEIYSTLALLLVVAALFAYLNHQFLHLPATIGLMALALVSSLGLVGLGHLGVPAVLHVVELVRGIDFDTVLMQYMLSFLLFAGAVHLDTSSLGRQRVPVLLLATLGTVISTVLVAGSLYLVLPLLGLGLPLVHCLVFGSLISPTDPVAVMGILTKVGLPKPLETNIVGESLFNDGVGVVLFATVVSVARHGAESVSTSQVLWLLLREGVGGLALGAALGYLVYQLLHKVDDYQLEVLLTLALVMGGSALATHLHTSGPLAMVVAGLIVGGQGRRVMSAQTEDYVDKFWELVDGVLNALLFVLIGLEVLVLRIKGTYVVAGLVVVVVVLVARFVSVSIPLSLLRARRESSEFNLAVLTWGGLRGGISVALALSLPATMPRELLVAITYVVVVFSILGQGLTIGPLITRLQRGRPVPEPVSK